MYAQLCSPARQQFESLMFLDKSVDIIDKAKAILKASSNFSFANSLIASYTLMILE